MCAPKKLIPPASSWILSSVKLIRVLASPLCETYSPTTTSSWTVRVPVTFALLAVTSLEMIAALELIFPLAVMWPAVDEKLGEEKSPLALMSPATCNFFVGLAVPIPTLSPDCGLTCKRLLSLEPFTWNATSSFSKWDINTFVFL